MFAATPVAAFGLAPHPSRLRSMPAGILMARPSTSRSFLRGSTAPGAALALVGLLALTGALAPLDRAWYDALQRTLAARAPLPADTALVLVDEQSLRALGAERYSMRWPWPRNAFSALFAGLHRAGARAIVVDLIFFENTEQDALLGAVAAGLPEVTLGSMAARRDAAEQRPVVWPDAFRAQFPALFSARPRWGSVRSAPDADGVIRRYLRGGSLVESALGIAPAGAAPVPALMRWRGNLEQLRARGVPVLPAWPFVTNGLDPLLARATEKAPDMNPVALARAIDEEPAPDDPAFALVRGRTVFVGVNAAGTFDAVATPVGAPEPGVITHWTAHANFVADDFLRDAGPWAGALALVVVAALTGAAGRGGLGLRRPALAAGAAAFVALGASAAGFSAGLWFAPAWPVVGAAATFSAVAVESFRLERARKREIQGWFGTYVSPAVVKRLVQDPDSLKLGGERREVSVYFSDLVGFTALSEKLPADQLVRIVNTALDGLSGCILEHTGYLDKYIGDAIMGVFGSPEEIENHALAACRAALDSQRRLAVLNEQFAREHGVRLGMRVGVNSGEAIVGNVGSERKRNYTVLGDAVNLASRLEGANKEFHTAILVGPLTAQRVAGLLVTRPVANLRVKGKTQAVAVHELIGEPETLDGAARTFVARYTEGFAAYGARRFDEATRAFEAALVLRPGDFLTTRYLHEARELTATAPPPDWEPILKLETK